MSDAVLTVYGVPASQPSRAVYWTCLIKGLAFELRTPELLGARESGLGELNPKRQIPTIVQGDFVLYEMPAILTWLCNSNGWVDLYPSDPAARALVDQYLHFHHSTTRLATMKLMAPHASAEAPSASRERKVTFRCWRRSSHSSTAMERRSPSCSS